LPNIGPMLPIWIGRGAELFQHADAVLRCLQRAAPMVLLPHRAGPTR
jgi:hypothetical protein